MQKASRDEPTALRDAGLPHVEPPPAPSSIAETGLDIGILVPLALKTIYFANYMEETALGEQMALPFSVTNQLLKFLQQQQLCEVTGGAQRSIGKYRYALTSRGVERATEALEVSGYVGPAPVPLADYIEQVKRQSIEYVDISPDDIERGLEHLVLPDETRQLIGQAVTSKRATLIYGASGNGKTSAALGLAKALRDEILIPHAIEVAREIVQLYDAAAHVAVQRPPSAAVASGVPDRRWLVIQRPTVFVAGELAATHLDLILDQVHKTYDAPVQMKANGGLLIIDDFGRQRLDADYLLNRWVTPLERGVDHLTLHSGARFEVPFDVVPIFVSNRPPAELADDAFLRRIRYKIEMPSPDDALFAEILKRECARNDVAYNDEEASYLITSYFRARSQELRGCHPRDLVEMIADAAGYRGTERALTHSTIDDACARYFAEER